MLPLALCQLLLATPVVALWEEPEGWKEFSDGGDLQNFVSRPELKAPRFVVTKHRPEAITQGYWFVAPQGPLLQRVYYANQREFAPCVNGPHIYDGDGELVWSGACKYDNRLAMNFRPVEIDGSTLLSFSIAGTPDIWTEPGRDLRAGVLINSHYEEVGRTMIGEGYVQDEHEFKIVTSDRTALFTVRQRVDADASVLGQQGTRRVSVFGFQEVKLDSNEVVFDWNPLEHGVLLSESCDKEGMQDPSVTGHVGAWDYFHLNSVEKFENGDYLISARHTSTVYRISGEDGHIIWKLGGCYSLSDFSSDEDAKFHWQHDAQIQLENATHIILSVFDNESEFVDAGEPTGHNPPVGKIIVLDTASKPMTSKLLRRFDRPDGGQTPAEGGMEVLSTRDAACAADITRRAVLINWAFEGYMSEFDAANALVLEARFISDRHRNYRAFKAPWIGRPEEPPTMRTLPLTWGQTGENVATAFYVSWNGATEVRSWRFYGGDTEEMGTLRTLATVDKHGFETSWLTTEEIDYAYVEGLDINGESLGRSPVVTITKGERNHKQEVHASELQRLEEASRMSTIGSSLYAKGPRAFEVALYALVLALAGFGLYAAGQKFLICRPRRCTSLRDRLLVK